jgi:hypothetical protein
VKFDAEFIPDIGTNDVYLWGEAPNFGRIRFSIDSVILVDHLGVRNPVHRENNLRRQAENPLNRLFRFSKPALLSPRFLAKTRKLRISSDDRHFAK